MISSYRQIGHPLSGGGIEVIHTSSHSMSYGDFVQEWKEIEQTFEIENLSIEGIEDMYWARICNGEKKFAINNPISLFGEFSVWNLNRFTEKDSVKHARSQHTNRNPLVSDMVLRHSQSVQF